MRSKVLPLVVEDFESTTLSSFGKNGANRKRSLKLIYKSINSRNGFFSARHLTFNQELGDQRQLFKIKEIFIEAYR